MAGSSLFVLVLVAALAWVVVTDDPYVAPPPRVVPSATVDPAGAASTLADLVAAVGRGDPAAAAGLGPEADPVQRLLAAVVTNAGRLRVRDLELRYVDQEGAVAADGGWSATVDASWRFAGFDPAPVLVQVRFGFREEDGEVVVTSVGGGDGRSPLWLTSPLQVRRGPTTLVLAAPGVPVDRYARLARAAVPVVRAVLPRWRPRLVVEVPATADALDRTLGASPGTYAGIAAVTTTIDGSSEPGAPVHVLVNPDELGRLGATGAQVVMSHEATHVATAAATDDAPLWLLEGFADYVALRDVDLPVERAAAQALRQVRRDGVPAALPGRAEFDAGGPHLGAVYESAWLVCTTIVERAGERALVRLYRAVSAGEDVRSALPRLTGLTLAGLVRAWQDRLRDLAG